MGVFHTEFRVERFPDMKVGVNIAQGLVDTGAEFTWVPETELNALGIQPVKKESFAMAGGNIVKRDVGFAVIRVKKRFTADEVVFAKPGDLTLLGCRTLEGLGLKVDSRRKRLVAAGPALAATAIRPQSAKSLGIVVPGRSLGHRTAKRKLPKIVAKGMPRLDQRKAATNLFKKNIFPPRVRRDFDSM